ncbi:MAG: hypothetical protein PHI90_09360 [Clostridia bacterium]|nr:hypothetical protein [Clostridia bacterium]MDD4049006.1 hypothetical protein [Clostridia bacterium]
MVKTCTSIACKNVFKSGENKISKKQFTQLWIELIKQFEKNKVVV